MRFLAFLYIYTVDYNIPNNLTWNSITEHKYKKYTKSLPAFDLLHTMLYNFYQYLFSCNFSIYAT